MSTREKLMGYRGAKRELLDLKSRMVAAYRQADASRLPGDRERAKSEAARYGALAKRLEEDLAEIEGAISRLRMPDARLAVRMRYLDGRTEVEIGHRIYMSDRSVRRLIASAVEEIEKEERTEC